MSRASKVSSSEGSSGKSAANWCVLAVWTSEFSRGHDPSDGYVFRSDQVSLDNLFAHNWFGFQELLGPVRGNKLGKFMRLGRGAVDFFVPRNKVGTC